jgi:5-methyltetrahydrofolate--homocysteine methyltransferase
LALTVSADNAAAVETIKAIKILHSKNIKTSLGVSNVSFGLPNRDFITSTFFVMAMQSGLNAAIMNPHSVEMQKAFYSYLALIGKDEACAKYIDFAGKITANNVIADSSANPKIGNENNLFSAITKGLKADAGVKTAQLIKSLDPMEIINNHIIPALDEVGKGFENKTVYLPQLLMSAEAATAAFEEVKKHIKKGSVESGKKIILATVKGDIHDIGKNIVKVLLENYGFKVIDLGRDVPPEVVLEKAMETGAILVGLSALMTTTVPAMERTVALLKEKCPKVKTMVGGAVLTEDYAKSIGASFYGKTAMDSVRYAEELFRK